MGKKKNNKQPILPTNIDELHEVENYVEPVVEEEVVEESEPEFLTKKFNLPEEEPTVIRTGKVNTFVLNIRERCSTDSEVLKVLRQNDEVEILHGVSEIGWIPVLLSDGTKGYCMKKFIN